MKPSYEDLLKENAQLKSENKVLKQNIENAKKALDLGFE